MTQMDEDTFRSLEIEDKMTALFNSPTSEDTMILYNGWASGYDKDAGAERPLTAYRLILKYFQDTDIRILDVGAGSGIVGQGLCILGYNNVDALDGNEKMLNIAKERGVYNNVICSLLGEGYKTDIPDDTYDCLVSVGCFFQGHMKEDAFPEMIRVTKPGGLIIIAISATYHTRSNWLDNFEPTMLDYSKKGYWTWVLRQHEQHYMDGTPGISYVFRKITNVS